MKRALITGITGQDGSYLAELLLEKGYSVYGLVRRSSSPNTARISHLLSRIQILEGDLADASSLKRALDAAAPHEVYNLAAMSDVKSSFALPEYAAEVNGVGVIRFLDLLRTMLPKSRFYQASTSELFGKVRETPQSEKTPFYPRSPYGVAKLFGFWSVVNYREAYDLFACNGILFNHESPRRGENFITHKITLAAARISLGLQEKILLGNLDAKRDWGYAPDFVEGMWRMLQQDEADDYVLATGVTTSVRRFVELSFQEVGIAIEWSGSGVEERGRDAKTGRILVEVSPEFFRPTEVELLLGDPSKAREKLGWEPKTSLEALASLMVRADLEKLAVEQHV